VNREINVIELALLALKRVWIIVVTTFLIGGIAFTYSYYYLSPQYISKGMIYVDNSTMLSLQTELALTKDIQYADMVASQRLATIYIEILKSQTFLKMVSAQSGTNLNPDLIGQIMKITEKNNTEILEIAVTHTNPHVASVIAETILESSKTEIPRIFKGGSVEIIDNANLPVRPSGPNHIKYTLIGIIMGMMLGFVLVIAIDLLDNRVKNQDDLISKYKYPMLGSIPSLNSVKKVTKSKVYESDDSNVNVLSQSVR